MSRWTLHHTLALCQGCEWTREAHPFNTDAEHARVLAAARVHCSQKGHYVQIERGQHLHYHPKGDTA